MRDIAALDELKYNIKDAGHFLHLMNLTKLSRIRDIAILDELN